MIMRLTSTMRRGASMNLLGLRHDRSPTAKGLRVHGFASVSRSPSRQEPGRAFWRGTVSRRLHRLPAPEEERGSRMALFSPRATAEWHCVRVTA
jgi:hypothetical protein